MRFLYGKSDWKDLKRGQETCYLLTNGLGGFSSMTMIASNARNDHALFMPCLKAPNNRYHMITKLNEIVRIDNQDYCLSSQEYVNYTKNENGYKYLRSFYFESLPVWIYQVSGVEIKKTIVMKYGENTIGIQYIINNRTNKKVELQLTPHLRFTKKNDGTLCNQTFTTDEHTIKSNDLTLYYKSNGQPKYYDPQFIDDLYFAYDAKDDRNAVGKVVHNHKCIFQVKEKEEKECFITYSMNPIEETVSSMIINEADRQESLVIQSGIQDEIGKQLVKSADQFIVNRESTKGKTIIAGYPFFEDWGRDTMIAMVGCCISTKRYDDAKSIFRTFMKYCKKGIMPNLFPEGNQNPIYNTVDASLLFIGAIYEYYTASQDIEFVKEMYPVMEDIIAWYQKGTDFHIQMEEDGLISAGRGYEQVTWMDVRIGDLLPTPRHGKPVEINAYWYNDLKIMETFSDLLGCSNQNYQTLAKKVKQSFTEKFWNETKDCLKDVLSGSKVDDQVRCNQIWAVSLPFCMLSKEQEIKVVQKVFETLYTPYGLRSLEPLDPEYKPTYEGGLFARDTAYHQGTVWGFPLGAYYLAYLKAWNYSNKGIQIVKEQLMAMESCLREGCVGQIAEIYDGEQQSKSKGCFAQAWSVGEILRVYEKIEAHDKTNSILNTQ